MPLAQTAVVPLGITTVVCEGGGGLLLLKLRHPLSAKGSNRANRQRRMTKVLAIKWGDPIGSRWSR